MILIFDRYVGSEKEHVERADIILFSEMHVQRKKISRRYRLVERVATQELWAKRLGKRKDKVRET
tara:strand:- start:609 stop:803 length:195 start_codon:yes stop_codon:yes gene_type:complete